MSIFLTVFFSKAKHCRQSTQSIRMMRGRKQTLLRMSRKRPHRRPRVPSPGCTLHLRGPQGLVGFGRSPHPKGGGGAVQGLAGPSSLAMHLHHARWSVCYAFTCIWSVSPLNCQYPCPMTVAPGCVPPFQCFPRAGWSSSGFCRPLPGPTGHQECQDTTRAPAWPGQDHPSMWCGSFDKPDSQAPALSLWPRSAQW